MTTMTEAFDTHMTDPGDIDISMYTGTAATDSWLPVEASMSDDAYAADAATFHYDQGGIEVEMGDDDEPITEYEMADEGEVFHGIEIQDVEVYDISQVPSPLPVDDHDIIVTSQSHVDDAEVMHIPSSEGPAPEPTLELHPAAPEVPIVPEVITVGDSVVPGHITDSSAVVNYDPNPTSTTESHLPEVVLAPLDGGVPGDEPGSTSGHFKLVEATVQEDISGGRTVESNLQYDSVAPPEFAQHDNYTTQDLVRADDHLHADILDESTAPVGQDENDPHEISDGVYIDPPPAVLLSLPPSAEFRECCLFNLPSSSTRQSPSSSAQPDTGDSPRLLLQERPTLYYEPLSAVFSALRQEEGIRRMHGFAEAELVLDAYDLQLSIPEDNIYTHEVTLHELNVIHDGSDLGGPLRLRLKVFTPRFVARYNMLRDQISRLNFAEDGERHADVAPPELYETEREDHDAHQADEGGEQDNYEDDVAQALRLQLLGEDTDARVPEVVEAPPVADVAEGQAEGEAHEEINEEGSERLSGGSHVRSGGGVVTGVDPAFQAAQLEAAEEEVAEEDADADGEYDESETFDADEVHERATVEEGGDYTEHAEFPDDEDEFGEDLPEDVGGETKDAAYPHIGAADDTPELPQDENDFEREVPVGVVGRHEEQQFDDTGLRTNPYTDAYAQSNSVEASETGVEDPLRPTSETFTEEDVLNNLEADNVGHEETTTLTGDAEDNGFGDNWDEADNLSSHENANIGDHVDSLSRKSSTTTLASGNSKRAYEEVDLDDFDDDDDFFDTVPTSPSAKRLRTE